MAGFSTAPVAAGTDLIVVIPCYNEPEITKTLQSLVACFRPDCATEIIVLVNACAHSPREVLERNRQSMDDIRTLAAQQHSGRLQIIAHCVDNLPGRQTGAGLPRKMLMDDALLRFLRIGNEAGVIVSLDADCTVDANYLQAIHHAFKSDAGLCSATLDFHHPVEHLPADDPLRRATEQYETYLHYYRSALAFCGYPHPGNTIGSAMAVRASVYAKAGGMGRQSAGEDFYFLQKVFPLGKTVHIDTVRVYPAARLSDRVPFGTGTAIRQIMAEKDLRKKTYSLESFRALKMLFDSMPALYAADGDAIGRLISAYPLYMQEFLRADGFQQRMAEIKSNTGSEHSFRKRFFAGFNAFKIVKYLNFVHPAWLPLRDVEGEFQLLLQNNLLKGFSVENS